MTVRDCLRIGFDVTVLAVFTYAMLEATSFSRVARYMPLYVSVAGMAASLLLLLLDLRRALVTRGAGVRWSAGIEDYESVDTIDLANENAKLRRTGFYLLWVFGYVGLVALIGLPIASVLFLAVFLRLDARMGWIGTGLSVVGLVIALLLLAHFVALRWPTNVMGW